MGLEIKIVYIKTLKNLVLQLNTYTDICVCAHPHTRARTHTCKCATHDQYKIPYKNQFIF